MKQTGQFEENNECILKCVTYSLVTVFCKEKLSYSFYKSLVKSKLMVLIFVFSRGSICFSVELNKIKKLYYG